MSIDGLDDAAIGRILTDTRRIALVGASDKPWRASANVAPAVDAAIRLHAKVVWMQLGVIDEVAAQMARAAGITVVMDRCPVIEAGRLGLVRT
jgi:predicted CoA-binding protein